MPALVEDFIKLLVQLASKNLCTLGTTSTLNQIPLDSLSITTCLDNICDTGDFNYSPLIDISWSLFEETIQTKFKPEESLSLMIEKSFAMICNTIVMNHWQ